jgi:hypothetical protein
MSVSELCTVAYTLGSLISSEMKKNSKSKRTWRNAMMKKGSYDDHYNENMNPVLRSLMEGIHETP